MWSARLFATGLTLLTALSATPVRAMALSAPAALKPAADSIRPVESVHCGYGCGGYAIGYGGCGYGCGGYGYSTYVPYYYYPRPYVYRPYVSYYRPYHPYVRPYGYPYVQPYGSFYRPYVGYGVRPYVGGYSVRYGYRSRFYGPRRWY